MISLRLLFVTLYLFSTSSLAQPIRLLVGYAPGGFTDVIARSLGTELVSRLETQVFVENRGGAAGAVALDFFINSAKPDGTDLMLVRRAKNAPEPDVSRLVPLATVEGESNMSWWTGVFAPPGTPPDVASRLGRAIQGALTSPGFQTNVSRLSQAKLTTDHLTPGDAADLTRLVARAREGGSAPGSGSGERPVTNSRADDPKVSGGSYKP